MWLIYTVITLGAWGIADLFYKRGANSEERFSHIKTTIYVGFVMGITAIATMLIRGIDYDFRNLYVYLPVSLMYILSMTVGYFGLRYLALSISSPIQNASGAISCILLCIVLRRLPDAMSLVAIVLVTLGVIVLGAFERREEAEDGDKKYKIGFVAFFMPIIYAVIDSLGTFLDGYYLDDISTTPLLSVTEANFEDVANISYELTFFIVAIVLAIYIVLIKREPLSPGVGGSRPLAAICETAGQFTYVYALSGRAEVAAPVIAAYCIISVMLARIFLKEKLARAQYISIFLLLIGIVLLAIEEI